MKHYNFVGIDEIVIPASSILEAQSILLSRLGYSLASEDEIVENIVPEIVVVEEHTMVLEEVPEHIVPVSSTTSEETELPLIEVEEVDTVWPFEKKNNHFLLLNNDDEVVERIKEAKNIILVKPVQSGKTSDVLKLVSYTYKDSATIFVSDKNTALAGQTNKRAKTLGWTVKSFRDLVGEGNKFESLLLIRDGVGKKLIFHTLMEINNLKLLLTTIQVNKEIPITLVIDEGDKNRNVASMKQKNKDDEEDEDSDDGLPIITRMLLQIKNMLLARNNGSRVVFVTATPQSLLVSEKDPDRLVVYKKPYNNYVGVGLNHEANIEVITGIRANGCKATLRWTEHDYGNTYKNGVNAGIDRFKEMKSRDTNIKQLMLISLESMNAVQERLAAYINTQLEEEDGIKVVIFNGLLRLGTKEELTLGDLIRDTPSKKIIVVAGYMASRGVSFTDFGDRENQYELCVQVHETDVLDPVNSSMQAMRIFGPARRTIHKPVLICNATCAQDINSNFVEQYRIIRDLAEGDVTIRKGDYNVSRPLTQKYNFRYMVQGDRYSTFLLQESSRIENHSLVV